MSARPPLWLSILRLCRIGTWFSPGADVVASAAIAGIAWSPELWRAVFASVLLYGAGMVWNDVADRRVDALQRPERPLPRGDLSLPFALGLAVLLLAGGIALSPCRSHHGLIAALVLAYDFGSKRLPWLGALTMGTLRGLNLATGLALAGADGLPPEVREALLVAALCYTIYIVAVTVLGIFEDASSVRGRAVAAVQSAPPIAAVCGVAAVQGGLWPATVLAALPALWFLRRNSRAASWDQASIRRSMLFLLLGTMVYTALLALAAGRAAEAAGIALAIPVARWIARRIALT